MVLKPWFEPLPRQKINERGFAVEFWLGSKLGSAMRQAVEEETETAIELIGRVIEGFVIDYWTGDEQEHTNGEKEEGQKLTVFVTVAADLTDNDGDRLELQSPFVAVQVAKTLAERARTLVGAMV